MEKKHADLTHGLHTSCTPPCVWLGSGSMGTPCPGSLLPALSPFSGCGGVASPGMADALQSQEATPVQDQMPLQVSSPLESPEV